MYIHWTSGVTWTNLASDLPEYGAVWFHPEGIANILDRIPSTTPGAEAPRDAKDSGSARSHSTHLETSSSNRP